MIRNRKFRIGYVSVFDCWYTSEHRIPRKTKKAIKNRGQKDPVTTMVELWLEAKSDD